MFTALIHCRLKPLIIQPQSSIHTHTLPWASVCGLSGAADGWLIDWGGPLMISVANDLLNNSLGLCWGTDGRPNTYTDMFTGRLIHTCALMHLFVHSICTYSNICGRTHSRPLHSRGPLSPLLSLSCCWHLGVLHVSAALVHWYLHPARSLSEQSKSYQHLLSLPL